MNEHRNDWIDHPAMEKIDPLKRELIRTAAKQTQGKSGNSLAPVMMALITSANKKGIRFEPEEISLISGNPERREIQGGAGDRFGPGWMIQMVNSYLRR